MVIGGSLMLEFVASLRDAITEAASSPHTALLCRLCGVIGMPCRWHDVRLERAGQMLLDSFQRGTVFLAKGLRPRVGIQYEFLVLV